MTVALLFPGQGAQQAHMLEGLPDSTTARQVLDEARAIIGTLGITGDVDDPGRDTVASQLALVTAGVACGRALTEDGGVNVGFVAGHSVGAFPAAALAGVISLRDALITVHQRAVSMKAVCGDRDWGMAAILGLRTATASAIAHEAATVDHPVWVANVNSATQTVLAGSVAGLTALEERARVAGARSFERLDVDIASHGQLQEPTAEIVARCLDAVTVQPPTVKYISNIGGRTISSAAAVCYDLAYSVTRPVRWYDGVRLMAELGVTCTVEVLPGHTLSRLVDATVPAITTLALGEEGFTNCAARARRHT